MKLNLESQPVGKFVVMRHSKDSSRLNCGYVHNTYDEAQAEAQRLAFENIKEKGTAAPGFYILQIQGRAGIFNDVLEDGSKMV